MIEYENVCYEFRQRGCELLLTKNEFENISNKTHSHLKIKSSCGHLMTVQLGHFRYYNSGVLCRDCRNKETGIKRRIENKCLKTGSSMGHVIENKAKLILLNLWKEIFDIIDVTDGCDSDILIKPKSINDNRWLKIQIKSTEKPTHVYSFHLDHKDYTNCIMAFVCNEEIKIWLLPFEVVKNKVGISIGLKTSKYNNFLTDHNNICQTL